MLIPICYKKVHCKIPKTPDIAWFFLDKKFNTDASKLKCLTFYRKQNAKSKTAAMLDYTLY
jgi:hypothetical protein